MSQNQAHDKHSNHHITPVSVYVKVLFVLLVLTVLTVAVSYVDFGKANIFVSMGIATFKAVLVLLFFMGLKYDNLLNRLVIGSSFGAVALFFALSASDLWTREVHEPVKVKQAATNLSIEDVNKLMISTPDLVAKGKEVFNVNCVPCHGANGMGDGVAAAALKPAPRNFHGPVSDWKNGNSSKAIYVTLAYGIAGSGMASYKTLPPADRWALVHYLHTFNPEVQATSVGDAKFDLALKEDGIGGGSANASKGQMPIDFAIERMSGATSN